MYLFIKGYDRLVQTKMKVGNLIVLKKGDIILIIVIIVCSVSGYALYYALVRNNENVDKTAVISFENNVIKRISLDNVKEPYQFNIEGDYDNVILVEPGRIRFIDSDCPDKICIITGWLFKTGDLSVCLPNRTVIKIEGDVDIVDGVAY